MQTIVIPQISNNDIIKPEYRDMYNKSLDKNDINMIIDLCEKNNLQEIVDRFNVRKIYVDCDSDSYFERQQLHSRLLEAVALTNNIDLFRFIHKKLCTDHKYYCLKNIDSDNQQIMNYKLHYLNKVKDGYEEE